MYRILGGVGNQSFGKFKGESVKALMWIIEIQMCLDVLLQVVRSGMELDSLRNFARSGAMKMLFIYSTF
jgi:hypothetical protein